MKLHSGDWIEISASCHVSPFVHVMCFDPWMWNPSSVEIPLRIPLNRQIKPDVFSSALLICAAFGGCSSEKIHTVLLWSREAASLPPSVSPGFIYRLRNYIGDGGRDSGGGKKPIEDSLAPVYCLKTDHTILLFPLYFSPFPFHCSCSPCSLPELLSEQVIKTPNVKNPTASGSRNSLLILNLVWSFYRLAPCSCFLFVCFVRFYFVWSCFQSSSSFQKTNILSQHWLWGVNIGGKKSEGKFWVFSLVRLGSHF